MPREVLVPTRDARDVLGVKSNRTLSRLVERRVLAPPIQSPGGRLWRLADLEEARRIRAMGPRPKNRAQMKAGGERGAERSRYELEISRAFLSAWNRAGLEGAIASVMEAGPLRPADMSLEQLKRASDNLRRVAALGLGR